MILQVELYWLCHALVTVLEEDEFKPRKLELLAKRQSLNVERMHGVAKDMYNYGQSLLSIREPKRGQQELAHTLIDNGVLLDKVAQVLGQATDRALLLSYVQFDPNLSAKRESLKQSLLGVIETLSWFKWDSPMRCSIAVDKKGRIVSSPNSEDWLLYPDRSWGCLSLPDGMWLNRKSKDATGAEQCTYAHPLLIASYLNTPNYFLWACVQETSSDESEFKECAQNLITSLIAYVTEEDAGSIEYNSPFPSVKQWRRVLSELPMGVEYPTFPEKRRETCHDVLASKEAISKLQLKLMQLIY